MILPILGAFFNRMFGVGLETWWASKTMAIVYYTTAIYLLTGNIYQAISVGLGMWLYRMLGWGDYWDGSTKVNHEVDIIDWIVRPIQTGLMNDIVSMSIRGLCCIPMFVALSFTAWQYSYIFSVFGMLQGLIYFGIKNHFGESKMSKYSEALMGALLMFLVSVSLYLAP